MNISKSIVLSLVTTFIIQSPVWAAEGSRLTDVIDIGNRLALEYDDNVYEETTDKQDSFKINEGLELGIRFERDVASFISLSYMPTFVWYSDREPDDTDFNQGLDIYASHEFSPRVTGTAKYLMRLSQQPQEISRGTVVREEGDYAYNEGSANVDVGILPKTSASVAGRYTMLDYDNETSSESEDRDITAAGLTIRQRLSDSRNVVADYRNESVNYDFQETADLRDYVANFAGLGLEQTMANFVGIFRAGYQGTTYENDALDDSSDPYGDATITYVHTPRTRVALSAAYSMNEASSSDYATQERSIISATFYHDPTAKIALQLSATYNIGAYDEATRVRDNPETIAGGDDEIIQIFTRVGYKVDTRNTIELVYNYYDLASDIQSEFDRNRVALGWRLDL